MKRMRFAAVAVITVVCMLATWITPLAAAPEAVAASPRVTITKQRATTVHGQMVELGVTATSKQLEGDPLPTSYNSVELGYLTPVKDQDNYGICWAFAAMACAETATIKNHLTDNPEPDYSELALAYFAHYPVVDPLGGLSGDTTAFYSDSYFLENGGNAIMTSITLGGWRGVTEESLAPYASIVADSAYRPDDSAAYEDTLHLEDAQWLPIITDADRELIKRKLLEYGAADFSVYYDDTYYNDAKGCYYTDRSEATNHEVVLVGWDDNYPADNFAGSKKGVKPNKDGAWLLRNSWAADWGNEGYFWVSYYDKSVPNDTVIFYDFAPVDRYDYNYQYDGIANTNYLSFGCPKGYLANVFTAQQDEELCAVSGYYYNSPGGTYTIRVYTGVTSAKNPASGTLAATVTGTYEAMGLQTDELPEPITLTAGTKFSVVSEATAPEDLDVLAAYDEIYRDDGEIIEAWYNDGALGQSYYSFDGADWADFFDPEDSLNANLRIHAYTKAIDVGETSETSEPSEESTDPWVVSEIDEFSEESSEEPSDEPTSEPESEPNSEPSEVSDEAVPGDADGDGQVSMKDVLLVRKFIAGLVSGIDTSAADVNGDGHVDMKDVLLLRKFIAGLITSFT